MNLPNKLTLLRVCMIPFFVIFARMGAFWAQCMAVAIYALACITDALDGHIARSRHLITDFGKFMDPLADKLLTIAAMTVFCQWDSFPAWALMIVLTREFAVTGLRLVAVGKGKVIAAGWSGKVKTASTMIGLCFMMAFPTVPLLSGIVVGVIVVTTVYSGVEYFIQNWNCLWDD